MDTEELYWPGYIRGQDPFENFRSIAHRIYNNGRQFESVYDLKDALSFTWDTIDIHIPRNLVSSEPPSILSLIEVRGDSGQYEGVMLPFSR